MMISMTDRGDLLDAAMRELAQTRLLFALSRFEPRIVQVDLLVADENGPRGGIDKSCRLTVALRGVADVIITDRDSDLPRCLSRMAERAARSVARTIQRSQHFDREHLSFLPLDPLGS